MKTQEELLWEQVGQLIIEIRAELQKIAPVKFLHLRREDELRLLQLRVWETRYRVSVGYILGQLVPFWKNRFARFARFSVFGTKVATLVGRKSEQILQEALMRDFPDKENELVWKSQEQERLLRQLRGKGKVGAAWWQGKTREYVRVVGQERELRRKLAQTMRRRRFRNNPWL